MSERDFSDVADPELLARLASWFGEGPLPPPDPDELERHARAESLDAIEAVVDLELRARIESHRDKGELLLNWSNDPINSVVSTDLVRLRIASAPEVDYYQEVEQPEDIREALRKTNTPQAILRDLFRPVHYFGDVALERNQDVGDAPTSVTRQLMATPMKMTVQPSVQSLIDEDLATMRSRFAEPWENSAIEAPTVPTGSDLLEHERWFGGQQGPGFDR